MVGEFATGPGGRVRTAADEVHSGGDGDGLSGAA